MRFCSILAPQMPCFWHHFGDQNRQQNKSEIELLKVSPQDRPRTAQDLPRPPQERPRTPQDHPKTPQDRPKTTQDPPKTSPRTPQDPPRAPPDPPGRPKMAPRCPGNSPRPPKMPLRHHFAPQDFTKSAAGPLGRRERTSHALQEAPRHPPRFKIAPKERRRPPLLDDLHVWLLVPLSEGS